MSESAITTSIEGGSTSEPTGLGGIGAAMLSGVLCIPAAWAIIGAIYGLGREAFCRVAGDGDSLAPQFFCQRCYFDFRPDLTIIVVASGFLYFALHVITQYPRKYKLMLRRVGFMYAFAGISYWLLQTIPQYVGPFESWKG